MSAIILLGHLRSTTIKLLKLTSVKTEAAILFQQSTHFPWLKSKPWIDHSGASFESILSDAFISKWKGGFEFDLSGTRRQARRYFGVNKFEAILCREVQVMIVIPEFLGWFWWTSAQTDLSLHVKSPIVKLRRWTSTWSTAVVGGLQRNRSASSDWRIRRNKGMGRDIFHALPDCALPLQRAKR